MTDEKKLNTRKKIESKLPTDTVAFTTSIIREQKFQIQQLIREIAKKKKDHHSKITNRIKKIQNLWPKLAQQFNICPTDTIELLNNERRFQQIRDT